MCVCVCVQAKDYIDVLAQTDALQNVRTALEQHTTVKTNGDNSDADDNRAISKELFSDLAR